jgi:hypothetical protein
VLTGSIASQFIQNDTNSTEMLETLLHVLVLFNLRLDERHVREHVPGPLDTRQASRVFANRFVLLCDEVVDRAPLGVPFV